MTRNSIKIAAALLAAAFLSAPPQPPATAQTKAPAKAPGCMSVQTAKHIAYKDGVLTLQDVSPMTVFFSDRPQRIVGQVRNDVCLQQSIEGTNSFKRDPTSAALSVSKDKAPPESTGVVLRNPRLNGNTLARDGRTLEGALPTAAIMSRVFIDRSGADRIKSSASC